MLGILLADHDADLAQGLHSLQIGGPIHAQELIGVRVDKKVPASNVFQGGFENIPVEETYGWVEDCGSGVLQSLEISKLKPIRHRLPSGQLAVIERQQTQHVDDGGAADQIGGQGRGSGGNVCETDKGCAERAGARSQ